MRRAVADRSIPASGVCGMHGSRVTNRWVALTSCAALIACGGARNAPETDDSSPVADRLYEYSASIPGYQPGSTFRVKGSLTVVGDSLFVQPGSGCTAYRRNQSGTESSSPGSVMVNCAGASLSFDARNMKSGRWITMVQVPRQRNVCVQYEPRDPARTQRCLRSRPETYYVREQRSGGVQIKLIS